MANVFHYNVINFTFLILLYCFKLITLFQFIGISKNLLYIYNILIIRLAQCQSIEFLAAHFLYALQVCQDAQRRGRNPIFESLLGSV